MSDTKGDRLLTREEVGEQLHVSLATLDRLRDRGEITARKIGRQVRFTAGDVDNYIEKAAS